MGGDRRVEGRRKDSLVLGKQVVGERVEVADPADHRGRSDNLVAVGRQLAHQPLVLRVALDEPVSEVVVEASRSRAVLAEVVDPYHLVTCLEQLRDQIAADEPRGPRHEDAHQRRMPLPVTFQISTTS